MVVVDVDVDVHVGGDLLVDIDVDGDVNVGVLESVVCSFFCRIDQILDGTQPRAKCSKQMISIRHMAAHLRQQTHDSRQKIAGSRQQTHDSRQQQKSDDR
jgi:hypothetical protein